MAAAAFLREQKVMRLTTVGPGGIPHTVPVWYAYSRGRIHVGTNSRTVKARNLRGGGRVAFCVDVGVNSPDIRGVAGHGRARLITRKASVVRIATGILLRYFDTVSGRAAQELLEDTDCIIEITPERMCEWSY